MSLVRKLVSIALCLALLGSPVVHGADAGEYEVKAAYLYRFLPFVTWPEPDQEAADQPVVIAIVGSDPFGKGLDEALRGKSLGGRPIVVERFHSFRDYRPSSLVFIAQSERVHYASILAQLDGKPVLVVGEGEEFCRAGGSIGFLIVDHKVRFAISQEAIKQAGLQISSKLMALGVACPTGSRQ